MYLKKYNIIMMLILLKLVHICKYVAIPKLSIFHVTMLYRHALIELGKN